jgi:uncharacterized protein (TIGR00290 family)
MVKGSTGMLVEVGERSARRGSRHRASLALSWSGGKDSALALHALRAEHDLEPQALITTVTEEYERVSMHGVRRGLLERQAAALGIELAEIEIPPGCSNALYEARLARAFTAPALAGVDEVAFGDLFLEDVRSYRERRLAADGRRALFPLWGRDTGELARMFIAERFEAVVVCVDPRKLEASFAGRPFDECFLADLPPQVDPCGENGEFHTFVHAGPVFDVPIEVEVGQTVVRDGFVFCDLRPSPWSGAGWSLRLAP